MLCILPLIMFLLFCCSNWIKISYFISIFIVMSGRCKKIKICVMRKALSNYFCFNDFINVDNPVILAKVLFFHLCMPCNCSCTLTLAQWCSLLLEWHPVFQLSMYLLGVIERCVEDQPYMFLNLYEMFTI